MKKMLIAVCTIGVLASYVYAQSAMPPAMVVTAAEIGASMASSLQQRPGFGVGTINSGEDYNINLIRRTMPAGAIVHEAGTELHYITEGAGILVTGGISVRPSDGGPASIEGGHAQRVSVGDAILIPAGTPHQYTGVEGVVTYLEVRFVSAQY